MVLHLNDVGAKVILTIEEEGVADADLGAAIAAATQKDLIFALPDGSTITRAAAFTTDGTDRKIEYEFLAGELSQIGRWRVRADLAVPGWSGVTEWEEFPVAP